MIYLNTEIFSGLGEDTFWTWFKREFSKEAEYGMPSKLNQEDIILQYSLQGACTHSNTIALLWELYPEMKVMLNSSEWDEIILKINQCAKTAKKLTMPSSLMVPYYENFGKIDILPIGVDTDLFIPMDKESLRLKHNLPRNKKIGIWAGTMHPMKGIENLVRYANENKDIFWIIIWKHEQEFNSSYIENSINFTNITQQQISELMSCADFYLSCGVLRPFFMIEWEAMACNVPIVILNNLQKDFIPSDNPRNDVFKLGWDRKTAKETWRKYIYENG